MNSFNNASRAIVWPELPRAFEPSPCARQAVIVSLVVGLEGPGVIQRHWEALVVAKDQGTKRRKCAH